MADFITLTGHDGTRIRFCIANIATYQAGHHGGIVTTTAGVFNDFPHMTDVRETPEQIDAMLGVTSDPAAETVAAALDAEAASLDDDATAIHNGTMRGDMKLRAKAFRDAAKMARDIIAKSGAGA